MNLLLGIGAKIKVIIIANERACQISVGGIESRRAVPIRADRVVQKNVPAISDQYSRSNVLQDQTR